MIEEDTSVYAVLSIRAGAAGTVGTALRAIVGVRGATRTAFAAAVSPGTAHRR